LRVSTVYVVRYGILLLLYTKRNLLHEFSKKTGWYHYHRRRWRGVVGVDERFPPPPSLFVDRGGIVGSLSVHSTITFLATTAMFFFVCCVFCFVLGSESFPIPSFKSACIKQTKIKVKQRGRKEGVKEACFCQVHKFGNYLQSLYISYSC